jgi:putative DNA primase/helicase
VHEYTGAQIFLYVCGPGGTGKTTFALLASALVGRERTITTSLERLNKDNFEALNLLFKKLFLINDSEFYRKDFTTLKNLTGCDSVPGREKHVQGSTEVTPRGLLLITSNYPLGLTDSSGAIERRYRPFPAENQIPISSSQDDLISVVGSKFEGQFVPELPHFFNCVMAVNKETVVKALRAPDSVPSITIFREEQLDFVNPIKRWIKEEILPGPGLYIGFKLTPAKMNEFLLKKLRTIYPFYERWCQRMGIAPLGHNNFSKSFTI